MREKREDVGVADITLLGKYRFFQKDRPGVTTRVAVLGGLELPTYDDPFSSESFDPIVGAVFTHQRLNGWVDWDVLYKANTGGGLDKSDAVRADIAYSQRLFSGEGERLGPWGLYGVAEMNGSYLTDGSTFLFASPGLQLITPRWIVEAGVQAPVHRDASSPRLEPDFTTVLSFRFQF